MFPQLLVWAGVTCEVLTTLLALGSSCGWTWKTYTHYSWQLLVLTKEPEGQLSEPCVGFYSLRPPGSRHGPQKGYSWSFRCSGPFCDDRMLAAFLAANHRVQKRQDQQP